MWEGHLGLEGKGGKQGKGLGEVKGGDGKSPTPIEASVMVPQSRWRVNQDDRMGRLMKRVPMSGMRWG